MDYKQCRKEVEGNWGEYNIPVPQGVENLLFYDLRNSYCGETRQAYVSMLKEFLKTFEKRFSIDKPFAVYHYRLEATPHFKIDISFHLMPARLSFGVHAIIQEARATKGGRARVEWNSMIKELKDRGFDVSWSGKYNNYISFDSKEDFEAEGKQRWHRLMEVYTKLIDELGRIDRNAPSPIVEQKFQK